MDEILIFAGTTEGRKLSEHLADAGVCHTVCVATEYGEMLLKDNPLVKVRRGRMDREQIASFLLEGSYAAVVDATHPYARMVTGNAKWAAQEAGCPYFRLLRETGHGERQVQCFGSHDACAHALLHTRGNILLTTGSKELAKYCMPEGLKDRLYVRVLPAAESLRLCEEQGICGKQVIAMQGPFSVEMNMACIHQFGISCLVTKESGVSGGYYEKLEAASRMGTDVFVIGRPEEEGYSFSELCAELERICGKRLSVPTRMEIVLAGVGMGSSGCLTREVEEAIMDADILFGAGRMVKQYRMEKETIPFYQAEQIIPHLKKLQENQLPGRTRVAILFSGDSGFYSGCRLVYQALEREIREGRLDVSVRILPGISSVSYFAAQTGESYHDAEIYSMHGKPPGGLAGKIKNSPKTFLLMSGVKDVNSLGETLLDAGLASCEVTVGYQLSYGQQQIRTYTPQECLEVQEEGLYTCLIKNPEAGKRKLTHGIRDDAFLRERVPMTKEEVRSVSICKLHLHEGAVAYDIGSGSGSIAVEMADLSDKIQVYAIEKKREAVSLIHRNIEKFSLHNITVLESEAPEGLAELPAATHAFIGGSGGKLREIISTLYQKNPAMRIVLNAITLETACEVKDILSAYPVKDAEFVQMQVNRVMQRGRYHMPKAENPIWIAAFTFDGTGGME